MRDIVIIGAGTAGLTAAIYACRAGRDVLVLEASSYGGQIINTPDIENYPGIRSVSGYDFATGLYEQATGLGAEVRYEKVTGVEERGDVKVVTTAQGAYEARAVIVATGAKNRPLGVSREQELVGRGVSYCATCDGMFFRGKDVAVVGGGNTAVGDALFLANIARKVYLVHRRDYFRGSPADVARLREADNVEFVVPAVVDELIGDQALEAIRVSDPASGTSRRIDVSGVFVAVGQIPDNAAFADVVDIDERGYVVAGEDCVTRTPGVFVAGDCRTKQVRQLVTAAGDGAVAATAASAYIG